MEFYHDMNKYTELPEAKSLRWLAFNFPKIENPADDCDRMTNCIHLYCTNAAKLIEQQRDELIEQEYTLTGVMHSVDKWLDGDELEQDEVNRAITMREKTLRIIETIKTDTAKAIFEEIEKIIEKHHSECYEYEDGAECDTAITYLSYLSVDIDDLKNKYLEASK